MYDLNYKMFRATLLLIVSSYGSMAQTDAAKRDRSKDNKSFVLYIGGGGSYYTASINNPAGQQTNVNRVSPAASIRLMWHPQYRLRIGLESGMTTFYSYNVVNGNTKGKLKLTAIPVVIIWSMPILKRVNAYAGLGSYFLTTHLDYLGKVTSKSVSLGANFAIDYQQPVSKNVRLAIEAKWMDAFVTKHTALMLQLQVAWKFLEWRSK
jgi:hypothetical protein